MKNITLISTILLILLVYHSYGQETWTQKANFPGSGKQCPAGFSIGTKGYWGTGLEFPSIVTNDFWEYDPGTNLWTQKADFPGVKRVCACGFSIGNKGYIGLGWDSAQNILRDFWEYDPNTDTWTQKSDYGGGPRFYPVGFSIEGKGYVGTGMEGYSLPDTLGYSNEFWEYDPNTNLWTQRANFPGGARMECFGFSIGNKGYIGGGFLYNAVYPEDDFWEWDQATDIWAQKANFGGGNICDAAGFSLCTKGYVCIGEKNDDIFTNELWQYNPSSNIWSQKLSFPSSARDETIGVSINGKAYVGFGKDTISFATDFWEYTPDSSCYSDIKESDTKYKFCIYPNPFSLFTKIKISETMEGATMVIFNLYGQQIEKHENIAGPTITLFRKNLPNGIYYLQLIKDNKTIASEKLIIAD